MRELSFSQHCLEPEFGIVEVGWFWDFAFYLASTSSRNILFPHLHSIPRQKSLTKRIVHISLRRISNIERRPIIFVQFHSLLQPVNQIRIRQKDRPNTTTMLFSGNSLSTNFFALARSKPPAMSKGPWNRVMAKFKVSLLLDWCPRWYSHLSQPLSKLLVQRVHQIVQQYRPR